MYIYDRPSQNHYYSNCVPSSQRASSIWSLRELGSVGASGVRFARVEQQGKLIHRGTLDEGQIKVRSGERLEIEELENDTPVDRAIVPGFIALEYKGNEVKVAGTKWLQFAWFELTANMPGVTKPAVFPGTLPSIIGGSPRPFTTDITKPQWFVDSASANDPFYDSAGFVHRSRKSITIFDRPGMLIEKTVPRVFEQVEKNFSVKADSVTFAAHYQSYLMQNNLPVYHVPWVATIIFSYLERTLQKPPAYVIDGTPGSVTALLEHLRTILHLSYPGYVSIR